MIEDQKSCFGCGLLASITELAYDNDLEGRVCPECVHHLKQAKKWLGMALTAPANGVDSIPVMIKGFYKGHRAPDNI